MENKKGVVGCRYKRKDGREKERKKGRKEGKDLTREYLIMGFLCQ